MARAHQRGFAALELLLIIVIVGIIAVVAWRVIVANGTVQQAANNMPKTTAVPAATTTKPAVTPTNTSDLTTLQTQIDNTNIDGNTTTDLATQGTF